MTPGFYSSLRLNTPAVMGGVTGNDLCKYGSSLDWPSQHDDFRTNTLANYTQTQDGGASTIWSIGEAYLLAGSTSLQGCITRNDFSAADAWCQCGADVAPDGGLVLRWQDQNNFYLLTLDDNSGVNPNHRIYKRVAGTFTQLAAGTLNWPRNTARTARFQVIGTTLTAIINGSVMLTATDSAISAAGKVGMRNDSTNMAFFDFRWGRF